MMEQLILHGIGDYILQTDRQALNKKKAGWFGLKMCLIHCLTYSLPFLFIGSWQAVSVIFLTHFTIDRTRILDYALAWKNGVKKKGVANATVDNRAGFIGATIKQRYDISNFGFSLDRPTFITIWLYIITDNLLHIICNYFALKYL